MISDVVVALTVSSLVPGPLRRARPSCNLYRACGRRATVDAMKLCRRQFQLLAAGAAALPIATRTASAQAYPSRPGRWLGGYAPGGGNAIAARLTGPCFSRRLAPPPVLHTPPPPAT